VLIAMLCCICI